MQHLCPTCQRPFSEPGFCPFDGTPLVRAEAPSPATVSRDQPTLVSAPMPAQAPPDARTMPDPHLGLGHSHSAAEQLTKRSTELGATPAMPRLPAVVAPQPQIAPAMQPAMSIDRRRTFPLTPAPAPSPTPAPATSSPPTPAVPPALAPAPISPPAPMPATSSPPAPPPPASALLTLIADPAPGTRGITNARSQPEPPPATSSPPASPASALPALIPDPDPGTREITNARSQPDPPPAAARARPASDAPASGSQLVARSASENPNDALELLRAPRGHEYDRLIGQTLDGRYYVENKIGEGGMGVVFSARHAVIERPLAIKVLKRDAMRDSATIRRFVQEAKAASRIGHPNIVDVTDFGTTPDGMTYSVMEFVPGHTLGAALRQAAPFPTGRALRITAQIARALAAAHDKGIVHRDLKPENVFLLDRDGRQDFVKIVDFGIAKVTPPSGTPEGPRLTRAGSVFGTPEYMAPEQAAGRGDTDGRVDIYALGVLLYEMICGRVPHRGESMVRTLAMQMLDPITPPSKVRPDLQIPADLEAVVMRALAKKREQRYQTMGELLEALEAVLPPAVGQSVTGSPVYTLAALPPGADPDLVPAVPAALLAAGGPPAALSAAAAATATPTQRRIKDEPVFTAKDRPPSFDHVFTAELAPARERRWPLLLLFALIAGGAAGAFAVVIKSSRATREAPRDAGALAISADAIALVVTAEVPADAATDALDVVVLPEPDAGRTPVAIRPGRVTGDASRHAIDIDTPNHRGTIMVQVLTRPEGATLYEGYHYRGPGGTQIEEPFGASLVITCRQIGYKPGTVEIHFDGRTEAVLCVLERIKRCIAGIKNPFDDCDD